MEFREFSEIIEGLGGSRWRAAFAGGLLSGAAAAGFLTNIPDGPKVKIVDTDDTRRMYERLKDANRFYDASTMKKLASMAKDGDQWAVREIAWPEGHKFHKLGRPFFRNKAAHPDGLKFYSGFEGD
jgi:hypothetical protein